MNFTLKMIGIMAVSAATFIIIRLKIKEKKKSISFITDFISSVKYMENLISVSSPVFEEVLEKTAETAGESRIFFENVAKLLKKSENPTLCEAWSEAALFLMSGGIDAETVNIIKRLGAHLGAMNVQIETENLKFAQQELLNVKDILVKSCRKDCKLIKSIGAALGGFVILIFI